MILIELLRNGTRIGMAMELTPFLSPVYVLCTKHFLWNIEPYGPGISKPLFIMSITFWETLG